MGAPHQAQDLLLTLGSEIIPGGVVGELWDVRDPTEVGHVQGK